VQQGSRNIDEHFLPRGNKPHLKPKPCLEPQRLNLGHDLQTPLILRRLNSLE
jgi:hypothetical protein